MFGFDLGKMLSGEGKGMGGMFGGSILNMVKGQLASEKTRKMITTKVVEMAQHLAATFTADDQAPIKKDYEKSANDLKQAYSVKANELTQKFGSNPTDEQKTQIETEIKEIYAATQQQINDLAKQTESKLKEVLISKNDISILSTLRTVAEKNDKGQIVLVADNNNVMVEKTTDAIFIEIQVKGKTRKTLQLDEFLATMLEQMNEEKE